MNKNNEHLRLTDEERGEMRARLKLFMAEHPVRNTFAERLFAKTPSSVPGVTFMQPALAAFLIVLMVGGGTTYAAAEALPGDMLYMVKTKINEPIEGAFAVSPEAKANWSAALAAKRLEEAGALALEGRLTLEARELLEENFEKHTEQFEESVAKLAAAEEQVEIAADVQSHMEVALKARIDVLQEVSVAIPDVEVELTPILEKIHPRVAAVESARTVTEERIAVKVGREIEEAAEAKRRIAEREVEVEKEDEEDRSERVATRVSRAKTAPVPEPEVGAATMMSAMVAEDTISTSTESKIEGDLEEDRGEYDERDEEKYENEEEEDEARRAYREGSLKFEEGKHGEAYAAFQKALRAVEKKKLDADVRKRLKVDDKILLNWKNKSGEKQKEGD